MVYKRKLSVAGNAILMLCCVVVVIYGWVAWYRSPMRLADRELEEKRPEAAAKHLAEAVRGGDKRAIVALRKFGDLPAEAAVFPLVRLMDCPDGFTLNVEFREELFRILLERLGKRESEVPKYDPGAREDVRRGQRDEWLKYLGERGFMEK